MPSQQGGKEQKKNQKKPAPTPQVSRREARVSLRQFRLGLRKARKSPDQRIKVVEGLVARTHATFVKPLVGVARKDSSRRVRAAAFRSLGRLDYPESRKALRQALTAKATLDQAQVLLGALEGLFRLDYKPADFALLKGLFDRSLPRKELVEVQRRIFAHLARVGEKKAFPFLLEHLEAPAPENVDDPDNPPASYWKQRWEIWQVWKQDVAKALTRLTGKSFPTVKEYRAWSLAEGAKKGFILKKDKQK